MSCDEFLNWDDDQTFGEWVDGEIELMSPASWEHGQLEKFLVRILTDYCDERCGGEIFQSQFVMRLDSVRTGRLPDVGYVSKEHLDRITPQYLMGPADLAIEIISTESVRRDKYAKYAEYERAGVREYWIVDPIKQDVWFYQLNPLGKFDEIQPDNNGVYHSLVMAGLWVKIDWFWTESRPRAKDVLRAWGID